MDLIFWTKYLDLKYFKVCGDCNLDSPHLDQISGESDTHNDWLHKLPNMAGGSNNFLLLSTFTVLNSLNPSNLKQDKQIFIVECG